MNRGTPFQIALEVRFKSPRHSLQVLTRLKTESKWEKSLSRRGAGDRHGERPAPGKWVKWVFRERPGPQKDGCPIGSGSYFPQTPALPKIPRFTRLSRDLLTAKLLDHISILGGTSMDKGFRRTSVTEDECVGITFLSRYLAVSLSSIISSKIICRSALSRTVTSNKCNSFRQQVNPPAAS